MNYYEYLARKRDFVEEQAIEVLLHIYINAHNWNYDDYYQEVIERKRNYVRYLFSTIRKYKKSYDDIEYIMDDLRPFDEDDDELADFDPPPFYDIKEITDLVANDIRDFSLIPHVLLEAAGILPSCDRPETKSDVSYEYTEPPEFKGIKLEELTKDKFEEFKKSYGMLKLEADKLSKTISIATQVGLLFYEKGLKKPASSSAFKKEYNKHFDGIPQRMVDHIYEVLPNGYKSLAGDLKSEDTIDDDTIDKIIEASIATGLICSKNEVENVKSLEAELARLSFEIPPAVYLRSISGASKRIRKKYKEPN